MSVEHVQVIHLPPDLSWERADALRQQLEHAVREGPPRLALGMHAVEVFSDAALGVIVRAWKETREAGGDLRLFAPSCPVRELLEFAQLGDAVLTYPVEAEAVASFAENPPDAGPTPSAQRG